MSAAESFCGMEQMTPRDNPGGKMVTPGMALAKEKSLDDNDQCVNSCLACNARQVTLDGNDVEHCNGCRCLSVGVIGPG
jgi:hypothetical protein